MLFTNKLLKLIKINLIKMTEILFKSFKIKILYIYEYKAIGNF